MMGLSACPADCHRPPSFPLFPPISLPYPTPQAGIVMGLSNTAGTLAGVVGVAATGFLLQARGGGGGGGLTGRLLAPCFLAVVPPTFLFAPRTRPASYNFLPCFAPSPHPSL